MQPPLSAKALDNLTNLILEALGSATFPLPKLAETEPQYVATNLLSVVRSVTQRFPLITCDGQGTQQPRPVSYLGLQFFPDITVMRYQEKLLAIEVKYLREPSLQSSVCTAIGQALVYQHAGYARSAVCLVPASTSLRMQRILGNRISPTSEIPVAILRALPLSQI